MQRKPLHTAHLVRETERYSLNKLGKAAVILSHYPDALNVDVAQRREIV